MKHLQNLHMHSQYCDGKNSLREIAEWAYNNGFESIGLSGHSYMYWNGKGMTTGQCIDYKNELLKLKEEYAGKLGIYTGIELEMHSEIDLTGYDYVIGSTHYFKNDNGFIGFDVTKDALKKVVDEYFGGNGMSFAKAYYRQIADLPNVAKIDIIGHFDICTKHQENILLFDTESKEYKNAVIEALEALAGKIPFIEINTGSIARGYKSIPYPELFIIKEMKRLGFGAVISSDCHDMTKMCCGFELASELLCAAGYKEKYILTDKGFCAFKL